jgi:hypothetical protein
LSRFCTPTTRDVRYPYDFHRRWAHHPVDAPVVDARRPSRCTCNVASRSLLPQPALLLQPRARRRFVLADPLVGALSQAMTLVQAIGVVAGAGYLRVIVAASCLPETKGKSLAPAASAV